MRDHLYKAQEEAILFPGFFDSRFKRIEYRKVGHYVPKGFLTMNLEKVTKTWSYAFISLRVLVY